MQSHTVSTHHFLLEPNERFRLRDEYGEDEVEILVCRLEMKGGSIWASGPRWKKDGTLSEHQSRNISPDVEHLPPEVCHKIITYFIGGS